MVSSNSFHTDDISADTLNIEFMLMSHWISQYVGKTLTFCVIYYESVCNADGGENGYFVRRYAFALFSSSRRYYLFGRQLCHVPMLGDS